MVGWPNSPVHDVPGRSTKKAAEHCVAAVGLLGFLGLLVNYIKCQIQPLQSLIFLGLVVDSCKGELSLPSLVRG